MKIKIEDYIEPRKSIEIEINEIEINETENDSILVISSFFDNELEIIVELNLLDFEKAIKFLKSTNE